MSKQSFVDSINEKHDGEVLKNILDIVSYLGENEMSYEKGDFNWSVKYKDKYVFYIKIGGWDDKSNNVIFWSADDYNSDNANNQADELLKEFAWSHISFCGNCGAKCSPGRSVTVFGKMFEKVCHCAIQINDPDTEELHYLKKLIEIRKNIISNTP